MHYCPRAGRLQIQIAAEMKLGAPPVPASLETVRRHRLRDTHVPLGDRPGYGHSGPDGRLRSHMGYRREHVGHQPQGRAETRARRHEHGVLRHGRRPSRDADLPGRFVAAERRRHPRRPRFGTRPPGLRRADRNGCHQQRRLPRHQRKRHALRVPDSFGRFGNAPVVPTLHHRPNDGRACPCIRKPLADAAFAASARALAAAFRAKGWPQQTPAFLLVS